MADRSGRSAALAERLQRLKAGLDRPKQASATSSSISTRTVDGGNRARDGQSTTDAGPPLNEGSNIDEDGPEEHRQLKQPEAETAQHSQPSSIETSSHTRHSDADSQEGGFEIVSSPHDRVQTPSGGSPASGEAKSDEDATSEKGASTPSAGATQESSQHLRNFESQAQQLAELKTQLLHEKEHREDLCAQISALRGAYVEARDSREAANEEVARLEQNCLQLQQRLREATTQSLKQAREEEATNVTRRLERAEQAIEKERATVISLQQQLANSQEEVQAGKHAARQNQSLEAALQEGQELVADLQRELQSRSRTAAKQEKDRLELEERIVALHERTSASEAAAKESAMKLQAALGKLHSLEGAEEQLRREKGELQERMQALEESRTGKGLPPAEEPSAQPPASPSQQLPSQTELRPPQTLPSPSQTSLGTLTLDVEQQQGVTSSTEAGEAEGISSVVTQSPKSVQSQNAVSQEEQLAPSRAEMTAEHRKPGWGLWAYISGADKAATDDAPPED